MLLPRKVKYRKNQRGVISGKSSTRNTLVFGRYGLKILQRGWVTSRQIEASRRAITRHIKRGGKVWIRAFPDKAVSARPPETRMGGGKGPVDHFVTSVKPGLIIFEMDGVPEDIAKEALRLAGNKLPVKWLFVKKEV